MPGQTIITKARELGLDPGLLYEAVIDLSAGGLLTAKSINQAAGILLSELGLPQYFFATITKESLTKLLEAIALSIKTVDGKIRLHGRVAQVDFGQDAEQATLRVRIASEETREAMENLLENQMSGHRREYYYSPESGYSTYIIRPETVADYQLTDFKKSRFLFHLAGDFNVTPKPTRQRYELFLKTNEKSTLPLIELYNLPETGETRLMFNSDFETPQLPTLRKLLADYGFTLVRAYWEPYLGKDAVPSSICSLYIQGELSRSQEEDIKTALRSFLSYAVRKADTLYLHDILNFEEMLFAGNAMDFCHLFIYQESENHSDLELLEALDNDDQRETFSKRLQGSNRAIYTPSLIENIVYKNPDLIQFLYSVFEAKFSPKNKQHFSEEALQLKWAEFEQIIASRFIDASLSYDIFRFMFKLITSTRKTNFYKPEKRAFAFRFDNDVLDPLVFRQYIHGIFYVNGHYASGTHLRAADIARGGLRMLRITRANYQSALDNAVLLNYALGPVAQRLKHKDICESGSKGVVIPHPQYACYTREALVDYTEGILDLMQANDYIVDYLGAPELIFFGPDEGTASFMDMVAENAKERGYQYWRTITTGKSIGIPHDTYGQLDSGEVFGLFDHDEKGVELQIEGKRELLTTNMDEIFGLIGGRIRTSGMTTTGVMSSFRALLAHAGEQEETLNLMITGGPDGDLGANQIQCYAGKICVVIDGGSILFDPEGLDKQALSEIAFARNGKPRANSTAFPVEKLSRNGFMVPIKGKRVSLPDGRIIEDGALFHRNFLTDPANRLLLKKANIQAFIPCGGFKDTINHANVRQFLSLFAELRFIVEGANVFFDDAARRVIAQETPILQIKDFSANKGGVFSSSVAEVLPAFLLQDRYEKTLIQDGPTRWALIRNIQDMVFQYARLETELLLKWNAQDKTWPLFELSKLASEHIFAFQDTLMSRIEEILGDEFLVNLVLKSYVPPILFDKLGPTAIMQTLSTPELQAYRDAILTKKIASMAFYRHGLSWKKFLVQIEKDFPKSLHLILQDH